MSSLSQLNLDIYKARQLSTNYSLPNISQNLKSQGDIARKFHDLFHFLLLLCILAQGSIGKEPVRKPDVVANTTKIQIQFS